MKGVWQITRKELLQHLYNKRFYVVGSMLMATMVLGAVLIPWFSYQEFMDQADPTSEDFDEQREDFRPDVLFSTYLAIPLLGGVAFTQLLAIVMTSDSVCSEWQKRTIFLLLSRPVSRSGFVMGKFLGTFIIVSLFATFFSLVVFVALHFLFGFAPTLVGLGGFFLGIVVLLLGIAAFTAFTVLVSSLTRSTVLSLLAAVSAWLLVFPLLGMAGFVVAYMDDDFRKTGHFDQQGALMDCGPDPRHDTYDPTTQTFQDPTAEEVATWEACWENWQEKVEAWYTERGLWTYDHQAALEACENLDANNTTGAEECYAEAEENKIGYETKREAILSSKWDEPRVDWSRYLNPLAATGVAERFVRQGEEGHQGSMGDFFIEDYSSTPTSNMLAVLALVVHTLGYLSFTMWLVRRRDFD